MGNLRGRSTALLTYLLSLPQSIIKDQIVLVESVRDLIRDLGRVRRDEILPIDHERIAHEEEDRKAREGDDGGAFELEMNEDREMEALERALEGTMAGHPGSAAVSGHDVGRWEGKREGELVRWFEARLGELEDKTFRG